MEKIQVKYFFVQSLRSLYKYHITKYILYFSYNYIYINMYCKLCLLFYSSFKQNKTNLA